MFGGVSRDGEGGRESRELEDRLGCEGLFQHLEGIIARLIPGPGVGLFSEVQERAGGISVTVRGLDIIFSIIHLSLLMPGSPFTFTISIMFSANTFCYMIQ